MAVLKCQCECGAGMGSFAHCKHLQHGSACTKTEKNVHSKITDIPQSETI